MGVWQLTRPSISIIASIDSQRAARHPLPSIATSIARVWGPVSHCQHISALCALFPHHLLTFRTHFYFRYLTVIKRRYIYSALVSYPIHHKHTSVGVICPLQWCYALVAHRLSANCYRIFSRLANNNDLIIGDLNIWETALNWLLHNHMIRSLQSQSGPNRAY
jgi:hypothetical protein